MKRLSQVEMRIKKNKIGTDKIGLVKCTFGLWIKPIFRDGIKCCVAKAIKLNNTYHTCTHLNV